MPQRCSEKELFSAPFPPQADGLDLPRWVYLFRWVGVELAAEAFENHLLLLFD